MRHAPGGDRPDPDNSAVPDPIRRGRAPAGLPWWLDTPDAGPAAPPGPAAPGGPASPGGPAAPPDPAAASAGLAVGIVRTDGRAGHDPAEPRSDRQAAVAPSPRQGRWLDAGSRQAVGQRWLVGLLLLVLGAGAVVVRGVSFAPAERRTTGAGVPAPATTLAQATRQPVEGPLYGLQAVPEQAASPTRTLPARGPAPVTGASGSMIVRYGGWLWRQRLFGGPASPLGPVPDSPVVALSPDGQRLALVQTVQGRPTIQIRSVGGRIDRVVNGTGPAWSLDGRLAYVRIPRAVATTPSMSRNPQGPELRVIGDDSRSSVPLPAALGDAQAGWTGDGNVLLLGRGGSRAGLFRADVEGGRLEALSPARGDALTRGLLRPADAVGPLGDALAGVRPRLVALAPDGRRVALVTGVEDRSRLDVIGSSRRVRIDLPADRFRSVHWTPGGNLVWLNGQGRLWVVDMATRRVVATGPGLPRGARILGLVP